MSLETAQSSANSAETGDSNIVDVVAKQVENTDGEDSHDDGEGAADKAAETAEGGEKKPEKTPEQKAIEKLERKLGRVVGQREQARAERQVLLEQIEALQKGQKADTTDKPDSEKLSLTRAEFKAAVEKAARDLLPDFKSRDEEAAKRKEIARGIEKSLGRESFERLTGELSEMLDGDAQLFVLDSDVPAEMLAYLTDEDNVEELAKIAKMGPMHKGKAMGAIEAKIKARIEAAKPKPSKAAAPIEATRSAGKSEAMPDPANMRAWLAWRDKRDAARSR